MPLEGGKSCSTCPTGQYTTSCVGQNDPGCACLSASQPGCEGVTIGQCPHEGCVRCKNCPAGRFAGKLNKEGCSNTMGPAGCMATVGSQSPGTSCDACPAGWSGGSSGCEQCPKGYFSNAPGQVSCSKCAPGKFLDELKQTECKACPHGKTASGSGATGCSPCGPGSPRAHWVCWPELFRFFAFSDREADTT